MEYEAITTNAADIIFVVGFTAGFFVLLLMAYPIVRLMRALGWLDWLERRL